MTKVSFLNWFSVVKIDLDLCVWIQIEIGVIL